MPSLPTPSLEAAAHSQRLQQYLRDEIASHGGWISFARYMELVLYAPGLGYYAAGATKFGAAGDFTTAPEISGLFGRCLARPLREVLAACGGELLEFGAGSGKLAADLLLELEKHKALPERYLILELSADLQSRQFDTLAARAPHLLERVKWLQELPTNFSGVMFGNEVLDAMPIHLVVQRQGTLMERGVARSAETFEWQEQPCHDAALQQAAAKLQLPDDYLIELNQAAPAFIASLATCLQHGLLLFIDYGFGRSEYYHPQRHQGTLMCHYRHHAHGDPFYLSGLQDITAHIDFSTIAEAGIDHGLELLGYANQANFLINCGITELLSETPVDDMAIYLKLTNQAQRLMSPAEMGELFKVIALGKGFDQALPGFARGDQRHRL